MARRHGGRGQSLVMKKQCARTCIMAVNFDIFQKDLEDSEALAKKPTEVSKALLD